SFWIVFQHIPSRFKSKIHDEQPQGSIRPAETNRDKLVHSDVCKSRKQKCHRQPDESSCRYCKVHALPCTTNQPRKKRLYGSFESVGTRIQLLETLVRGLVPEAHLSSLEDIRRVGSSMGIPLPEDADASVLQKHSTSTEEPSTLVPDQQGSSQYTGPLSSYNLHLKLRSLLGDREDPVGFKLFGRNASESTHPLELQALQQRLDAGRVPLMPPDPSQGGSAIADPIMDMTLDLCIFDEMVPTYLEKVQPDFPLLHEPTFIKTYEEWRTSPSFDDRVWVCTLLCMSLLASRLSRTEVTPQQRLDWWRGIQALLPTVLFTSSIGSVQALLLAALHLQNTARRDACWNLTGAAVRIAHAIGLHNDEIRTLEPPTNREIRKMVFWALFSFEQIQISSYDRPSAIDYLQVKVGYPDERICGMSAYFPPDICRGWIRLVLLLACACRARKQLPGSTVSEKVSYTPLSPAASALRDMVKWKESLPPHLKLEAIDAAPPNHFRVLLTLHTLYHYNTIVLSRSALLHRATLLSQSSSAPISEGMFTMSEACRDSSRAIAECMLNMHARGKFNCATWYMSSSLPTGFAVADLGYLRFDAFFAITGALGLVLDIICAVRLGQDYSGQMQILLELAAMAEHYKKNPRTPETLYEWTRLITELVPMVQKHCSSQNHRHTESGQRTNQLATPDACLPLDLRKQHPVGYQGLDPQMASGNIEQQWDLFGTGFDTSGDMHDWHWGDIEAMLNA
ncbi:zn2 cys6 DNA-binding protein, partial [Teratosphaeria destructans]